LQKLNIGHTGISYSIAKISNEKKASGDRNDKIIIWKIGNGEILKIIDAHSGGIWSLVKLSNNILISCSNDKTIKVWDIESGN
jgi:WD40 repeat protein